MKECNKLLLALSMASKIIIKPKGAETIKTVKNVTKENFNKLTIQHLLGKTRLGVTPEILGHEDKIMFGSIDIDCPDISHEEKYKIALSLQDKLLEDYGLKALIETSKSKGFHVWVQFLIPQERSFIKYILENVINSVTDRPISNGEIEVFPKGDKGNAIFLPLFGMFINENTLNENYFTQKKNTFVKGKNMKVIKNPLEAIHQAMRQNDSILPILKELSIYPECVRKAFFEWKKGNRHYLTMAIAGILKKICKVSEAESISLIKLIAQHNHDEEINDRISAVKSTYKSEEVASCSIMQGNNENIAISNTFCTENCELIDKTCTVKTKVRKIQAEFKGKGKGFELKDRIAELIKSEIEKISKIFKSNNLYYLFLKDEKRAILLADDSQELKNLLTKWGINASESIFRYVMQELFVFIADTAIEIEIHRFAYYDEEKFTLYLYNTPKFILKITDKTVATIENGDEGVMFAELKDYKAFDIVNIDKNTNYLYEYFIKNLNFEQNEYGIDVYKLVELWFFSLFFESILDTKPLFVVIGEKGSGKTSFLRRIGQFLVGDKFNVTSVNTDNKNLISMVTNNYLIVIDNMDSPTTQINDTLARISTGQVIKMRQLYTTNTEVEYPVKCFVALTSRKRQFQRDDISDRLICVFLKRFNDFFGEHGLKKKNMAMRNIIMSYVVSKLQSIIGNLKKNKDKSYSTVFRIADFAEFAFRSVSSDKEVKELEDMFLALSKQQKDFATREDVIYMILKEIVGDKAYQGKKFSSPNLYKIFKSKAEDYGLDKFFNGVYTSPKAITSQLMHIKDNISDEIIINRKKGNGNSYYYSFSVTDKTKPISDAQEIEMLMDREVEEQINAYERYKNNKGGKDE